MGDRRNFEMSEDDLAELMARISAARQTSGMFLSGGMPMSSPQEAANAAWAALGKKMGFDPFTVAPASNGGGNRYFSAVPVEPAEAPAA